MTALVMKHIVVINSTVDLLFYNNYFICNDEYYYGCILIKFYVIVLPGPGGGYYLYVTLTGAPTVPTGRPIAAAKEQGVAFYAGELK